MASKCKARLLNSVRSVKKALPPFGVTVLVNLGQSANLKLECLIVLPLNLQLRLQFLDEEFEVCDFRSEPCHFG